MSKIDKTKTFFLMDTNLVYWVFFGYVSASLSKREYLEMGRTKRALLILTLGIVMIASIFAFCTVAIYAPIKLFPGLFPEKLLNFLCVLVMLLVGTWIMLVYLIQTSLGLWWSISHFSNKIISKKIRRTKHAAVNQPLIKTRTGKILLALLLSPFAVGLLTLLLPSSISQSMWFVDLMNSFWVTVKSIFFVVAFGIATLPLVLTISMIRQPWQKGKGPSKTYKLAAFTWILGSLSWFALGIATSLVIVAADFPKRSSRGGPAAELEYLWNNGVLSPAPYNQIVVHYQRLLDVALPIGHIGFILLFATVVSLCVYIAWRILSPTKP